MTSHADLVKLFRPGRVITDEDGRTTVLSRYEPCEVCGTYVVGLDHKTEGRCVAEVTESTRGRRDGHLGTHIRYQHHWCRVAQTQQAELDRLRADSMHND